VAPALIGSLRFAGLALLAVTAGACGSGQTAEAPRSRSAAAPVAVAAIEVPPLTGRVVDRANLLTDEDEARLSQISANLERRTSDQLVIVTLPDLQGHSIEDFGLALGRQWGVGQADKDNGVLLVVAPIERKVRIEVGYGLEPILTNGAAQEIIGARILPAFGDGRFGEGSVNGAQAIADRLIAAAGTPRVGHRP
jgi:uncharacterized protein